VRGELQFVLNYVGNIGLILGDFFHRNKLLFDVTDSTLVPSFTDLLY
jgi:hypothetical protein